MRLQRVVEVDDAGLDHLVVEVVALAGALADAGEHRHAAMRLGDVVDQLHERDGSDFRNQMCAVGLASSMWPMRSRRTLRLRDFHAALLADDAAMLEALVLAAKTFVVLHGPEDLGAEEPVPSGLKVR